MVRVRGFFNKLGDRERKRGGSKGEGGLTQRIGIVNISQCTLTFPPGSVTP